MDNGFQYATWDDAAEDYINDILERLRDTHPACVLPPTWQQLRETISAALDDLDTSAEPWPDDPDGKLWNEYMDKIMEALRAEIEQALQDCQEDDFAKKFWGAGENSEK